MQETLAPSKELVNKRKVLYGHTFNHEIGYLLCLFHLYEVAGSLCCLVLFSAGRAQTRVSQERVASKISVPASILIWRLSDVFQHIFVNTLWTIMQQFLCLRIDMFYANLKKYIKYEQEWHCQKILFTVHAVDFNTVYFIWKWDSVTATMCS